MLKPISKDNFEIILKTINSFFNLPSSTTFDAAIYKNYLDKLRVWEITSFSIPVHYCEINDNSLIEFENKYEVKLKTGFGLLSVTIKDPDMTLTLMKLENR